MLKYKDIMEGNINYINTKFKEQKQKNSFEVMKTPEIVVQEEKGAQLLSLLLKAENKKYGETKTPLAKEAVEYFEKNPLSLDTIDAIREFHSQDVDEETLYNFALTYQHPERTEKVFEMVAKYKPHVKNPQEVYKKILNILESFDQTFSSTLLAEKFTAEIERDKKERLERIEENIKRIEIIINFFKPDSKTTNVKKVSFIPTDPLYKKNSGRSFFVFPGEQIIISYIKNILNQDHEFSHGIINPIVEKLSEQLTNEQKERISQLASKNLKQDYDDGYFSLLCEEFIKTYTKFVAKGRKPEKYFKWFRKNQLRNLIFSFYQDYLKEKDKKSVNFERFVLENFIDKLVNYNE